MLSAEVPVLERVLELQPESSAFSIASTPRSIIRSDITTLDSCSSYHLPTQTSEFEVAPTLSSSGDSIDSGDSSTPDRPRAFDQMAENLARRPDDEFRFRDYIYDPYAPIYISDQIRQGGILPSPGTRSHLPCLFRELDGCAVMFDIREKKYWKLHNLSEHLGNVKPPQTLVCTFGDPTGRCCENFVTTDGNRLHNWNSWMEHFAKHYEDRLSTLHPVFGDEDPVLDANALEEVTDTPDEHFRLYILRERRRLEAIIRPNLLPLSYGGPRSREVVYRRPSLHPEPHLDSTNATQYSIEVSGRRVGRRDPNRNERVIIR